MTPFKTDTDAERQNDEPCPHCGATVTFETRHPTCIDETYTQYWKCLRCGRAFETEKNIFEGED